MQRKISDHKGIRTAQKSYRLNLVKSYSF